MPWPPVLQQCHFATSMYYNYNKDAHRGQYTATQRKAQAFCERHCFGGAVANVVSAGIRTAHVAAACAPIMLHAAAGWCKLAARLGPFCQELGILKHRDSHVVGLINASANAKWPYFRLQKLVPV